MNEPDLRVWVKGRDAPYALFFTMREERVWLMETPYQEVGWVDDPTRLYDVLDLCARLGEVCGYACVSRLLRLDNGRRSEGEYE